MVWGGCKNYLGNHKSCDHNVIVHPGIPSRSAGGRRCQTDDNSVWEEQYHHDNHCFTADGEFYTMKISQCTEDAIMPHVYTTFGNALYSPGRAFSNGPCTSFESWQKAGQDVGSSVAPLPAPADIVAIAEKLLM